MDRGERVTRLGALRYGLVLLGCGAAGLINGIVGVGGGIVLVWIFSHVIKTNAKDAFAQSLLTMIPMSLVSCAVYLRAGELSLAAAWPYLIPAALGGALGAWITDRLNPKILKIIFGLLVVYSGLRMIFVKP